MKILLFVLSSLLSLSALAQSRIWNVEREEKIPAPPATQGIQQIRLQIVMDSRSEWAVPGMLTAQVAKASKIFRQCDVEFGEVEVKFVSFTPETIMGMNKESTSLAGERNLVAGELSPTRPVIFLFGTQIPESARAYTSSAVKRLSFGGPKVESLKDVTILTGQHCSNKPVPGAQASYSTLAHEIAHLAGDLPHTEDPNNLMTEGNVKTGRLNAEQCEKIRQYSLINYSGLKSPPDCP